MPAAELSLREARRLALHAQGLSAARPPGPPGLADVRACLQRLGLVQIDFVNLIGPAHYHVPFSRLGPYDRGLLDALVYGPQREFTEQWAHEASIVPLDAWPLLEHRRQRHRIQPYGFERVLARQAAYAAGALDELRRRGPLSADELPSPEGLDRRLPGTWVGTVPRAVLEAHFGRGLVAVVARRPGFARSYDLAERVIPPDHHARRVEPDESRRELLRRAARALGVATAADLADYWRMPVREARPHLLELAAAGELGEVRVEGWREPAYVAPGASPPRAADATALLSPFDPLVFFRPRLRRLFDFEHRFEIFVPAEQRRWGVYVLPFLQGERLVARVDLKADRANARLLVLAAHVESHARPRRVAAALAVELRGLAAWLGLAQVRAPRRGGLARALAAALRDPD